jgi:Bacterial Ig-like domain (group 2)
MMTWLRRTRIIFAVALLLTACRASEIAPPPPAHLVSVTISPSSSSIAPGTTTQLNAVGKYDNNAQLNLTTLVVWTSTAPAAATVDSKGLVTAAAPGSATIIATYQGMSGSAVVISSMPTAITVSPAAPTIAGGTAIQFSATGTLGSGATQDLSAYVTWSSSNTGIASINSTGLAQAAASTTGSTTITALFGTVSGTTTLTSSTVASLSITPAVATIVLGATQQFTAVGVLTTGGTTQNLSVYAVWSSSSPTVATIGNTAGSQGLAVSVSPGTTLITASFGGATSNPAALTINAAVLNSITVTPSGPSLAKGMTQQFIATGTYSDGTIRDITSLATWASSNSQVAIVSNSTGSSGVVTALSQGTTLVTASFGGITSPAITLSVTAPVLTSISVTPSNPSIIIGGVLQFTATGIFSDGTTQDLTSTATWTSSNTAVATISMFQGSQGFATSLMSTGTTTITATSGSVSGNTVLTVTF